MRKRIIILIAVLCLFAVSGTALAAEYSYSFTFNPPFVGSLRYTEPRIRRVGDTPYVWPNYSTTPTNYVLVTEHSVTTPATNTLKEIYTAGKRYFSYLPNYGGYDEAYRLAGYPTYTDFDTYTISGKWSP